MMQEKRKYRFGGLLFLISIVILVLISPFAVAYTILKIAFGFYRDFFSLLLKFFWYLALAVDQLGNVLCQYLFNDVLIKPGGYKFGDPDHTISAVLGKNKIEGTLRKPGEVLSNILNYIDKDHVEKAARAEFKDV